ncbi:methyltransferase domain-containing protein [Oculatella sp. LEGE 06141]|uniref:methyltransferase domain-containing protein n=1 Tax=Oculatella sp. LEGE 06141 TaxID=1828648 RepID=UPI00187F5379|nr:methyltransferase domain-containing protein [Oculatella sp. LEGE 06141]MBE9182073.1 methyltransferase domain-containing protein [Oculatella sp. LEGE 06141]
MQFCKVADIADWQKPEFHAAYTLLQFRIKDRKTWEFTQVYTGLQTLGLLNEQSRALGLGSGRERLIFAFSNVCKEVTATDLYSSQSWATAAMRPEEVFEQSRFPYRRDRLRVHVMDMTKIDYPDNSFDFIWSCCAIEHVNNFKDLYQVYAEIHRVLKPGGVAALTTEFNKTDRTYYEQNLLYTDQYWMEKWLTGDNPLIQGFELVDEPNFAVTPIPENEPTPRRLSGDIIQVYTKDIVNSSIAFFLRKTGEFSRPYDESWLPPFWSTYLASCDRFREKKPEEAEVLLKSLLEDETLEPRLRVRVARRLIISLYNRGQVEEAIDRCKAIFPDCQTVEDGDQLLPLAVHFRKVGLLEEARALYERVEHLPSSSLNQTVKSVIAQAEYYEQQRNYDKALELLARAHEYHAASSSHKLDLPVRGNVHFHQGLCYEQLGQLDTAIECYQTAIELAQPNSPFYVNCQLHLRKCQARQVAHPQRLWSKVQGFFSKG